jgi:tRNA threonylcarbamoyladenosine biosynthesis protein TsaE
MKIEINQLSDLQTAAVDLLRFSEENTIFVFEGEMGAGKTTFIKAICASLGIDDLVSSPTFSIVNEYESRTGNVVYHFDFYRIKNLNEAYDIGYEEYFYSGNICLIEWPEKIADLLPENYVRIKFELAGTDRRILHFDLK